MVPEANILLDTGISDEEWNVRLQRLKSLLQELVHFIVGGENTGAEGTKFRLVKAGSGPLKLYRRPAGSASMLPQVHHSLFQ